MMERNSGRPLAGSQVDVTPQAPERADLMTNWPEHVDAYLQYIHDVMRMCGAPMGLRATLISFQGQIREQRRPGRVMADQANQAPKGQPLAWPAPPTAVAPLERIVYQPGNSLGQELETPEGRVKLNLPSGGGFDLTDIPPQFRQAQAEVLENENPRDLS